MPFSTLNLSGRTPVSERRALGADGGPGGSHGAGGDGGDGLGGAIFNAGPRSDPAGPLPAATRALFNTLIIGNLAQGGNAGDGDPDGSSGQGTGGGLFLATGGTATLERRTVVAAGKSRLHQR